MVEGVVCMLNGGIPMSLNFSGRASLATLVFAISTMATLVGAAAAQTISTPKSKPAEKNEDIRVNLAKQLPGTKPEDVRPSPIPGVYEIAIGTSIAYISADGKYLISGDMYEIASKNNLSEVKRSQSRMKTMASIKESDTIVFGPAAAKHTVTVFIDVDCGYCRKMHAEIAELNKLGVRVRYTAYPRSGPGTSSWAKMETIWCSKNRRDALTKAQLDEDIGELKCGATPVASQFKLGDDLGVNGTPAIFTESGDYIGGYLPPQKLVAYLDELKAQSAAPKKAGS
jgi:thiol:disulfide interchange protein DsbC